MKYLGSGEFEILNDDGTNTILGYNCQEVKGALKTGTLVLTESEKKDLLKTIKMVDEAGSYQRNNFGDWNF